MTVLQVTSCGRRIDLAIAQDLSLTLNDEGMGDSISVPVCDGTMTIRSEDFSPLYLFQSGEQGVWFDPSDFSTMFQDSAGTTPATAVGQAVGRILDKSGRGNHASQATPTRRPILRQDAGGRYYLEFDGVDDVLFTGSVNPSGVNKAQVFAGVRKLSDAALGIVVETSTSSTSNAGTIYLLAPGTVPDYYAFRSGGTTRINASATSAQLAAPITNVLTGLGDISGDLATIRANGTQAGQNTADQGTGNFLSYPLYIGSRAGSSLRFNGNLYSLIVRFGANLNASVISQTETWVNGKTMAY